MTCLAYNSARQTVAIFILRMISMQEGGAQLQTKREPASLHPSRPQSLDFSANHSNRARTFAGWTGPQVLPKQTHESCSLNQTHCRAEDRWAISASAWKRRFLGPEPYFRPTDPRKHTRLQEVSEADGDPARRCQGTQGASRILRGGGTHKPLQMQLMCYPRGPNYMFFHLRNSRRRHYVAVKVWSLAQDNLASHLDCQSQTGSLG